MFGIIGSVLSVLGGSILSPILSFFTSKQMYSAEEFVALTGAQQAEYVAYVEAVSATNQAKVANNVSFLSKIMVMAFGVPAALHWGAVFLDSTFKFHWGIPALPGAYAGAEQQIALSFFILTPAMPIVSSLAAWLRGNK